jgi:hypothetical protein
MNSRFTAAYNASNLFTIAQMANAMDSGSNIALISFLTSFFLLAALLVVQFVMSVRNLAQQNFSTLVALAKIPKKTVSQLKDRADELYFQYNAECGEGEENEEWVESDSDFDDDVSERCTIDVFLPAHLITGTSSCLLVYSSITWEGLG